MEKEKRDIDRPGGRRRAGTPAAFADASRNLTSLTVPLRAWPALAGDAVNRIIASATATAAVAAPAVGGVALADMPAAADTGSAEAAGEESRVAELERRIARLQAERDVAEERVRQFTELFDSTPVALLAVGRDGRIRLANQLAQRLLDLHAGELSGSQLAELVPEVPAGIAETLLDAADHPHPATIAEFRRTVSGEVGDGSDPGVRWLRLDAARGACGENLVCALSDITIGKDFQRRAEEALQTAGTALNVVDAGVVVTNADNCIQMVNPAFSTITGYGADEVLGLNPRVLASGTHDKAFYRALWARIEATGGWHGEMVNRHKNGKQITVRQSISVVRDADGNIVHYVAVFNDVTARKQAEARHAKQAPHDPLTQLPGRSLILDRIGQALARARREKQRMAILYVTINGFRELVDGRNRDFGDAMLRQLVQRLLAGTRDSDTLARLGSGEFVILLPRIGVERDAETVARKIVSFIGHPFELEGERLGLSASVGLSVFPEHGYRKLTLLRNAHRAMNSSRRAGAARVASASGLDLPPVRPVHL